MKRALLIAALLFASTASADEDDERPTEASVISTDRVVVIAHDGDLDDAVLVGPSGQAYAADGKGHWRRTHGGGVAADVRGAALVGDELVVAGRATPMYRRDGSTWFALRIGETGRTVMGAGPAPAVAIGKHVFVHAGKKGWTRVGSLPAKATAVWASGAKTVWAATESSLYKLRGKDFGKAGATPRALVGGSPWAITDAGLRDLGKDKTIPAELDGAAVTIAAAASAGNDPLHVVAETASGTLVLATVTGGALARVDDLPVTGRVATMAVGKDGEVLVALADGTVAVRAKGTWTTGAIEDDLPAPKPGAKPARSK